MKKNTSRTLPSLILLALVAAFNNATSVPARAHAFADVKRALVDYSKADLLPKKGCADIARFKGSDITQLSALDVPASGNAPSNCRVTGMLSPEIAFEIALPTRWNG